MEIAIVVIVIALIIAVSYVVNYLKFRTEQIKAVVVEWLS